MALLKDLTVYGATNLLSDTFTKNVYADGFYHNSHRNNDSVLLAGGGYKLESSLSVSYAANADNADTVDYLHATTSGSLLYKYNHNATIETSTITSEDYWYATISFTGRSYINELTKSIITATYSNIQGIVYLDTYAYNGSWYAFTTNYNGCNIVGMAVKTQNKPIYYIKLKKPVTFSGNLPNGNITVSSTYDFTISVSTTPPDGVTFTSVNCPGFTNLHNVSNLYWANLGIQNTSSTTTTPQFTRIGLGTTIDSSYSINAASSIKINDGYCIRIGVPGGAGSNNRVNYLSAGSGYSNASGRYGVKVLACDQSDCQSGLGQDVVTPNGWSNSYNFCLIGGNSSSDVGYISFATHKVNSTVYRYLGGFKDNVGTIIFKVMGDIYGDYFNSTISDEDTITVGSIYVRNNSDDFIRRMSLSKFSEIMSTNIRDTEIISFPKTLKITEAWMNTGITTALTDFPEGNGTYAVQISHGALSGNDGTESIYSGIMTIYTGTDGSNTEEVILHRGGKGDVKRVYLRIKQTPTSSGYCNIEIAASSTWSAAVEVTFKFRKLI